MLIKYYGVRGSLPTPGKTTVKYGGNTTCISLEIDEYQLIVDGGSGLRILGNDLMKTVFSKGQGKAIFFWSHLHWDHIMGFPFFIPNFIPGNAFVHYGSEKVETILKRQQDGITFPVEFDKMPSQHTFKVLKPDSVIKLGKISITTAPLQHPGGGYAYKFMYQDKSLVIANDFEQPEQGLDPGLLKLCQGADILIHDAQYTNEEYSKGRKGWGHSTWQKAVELAKVSKIKKLHLFHHDQLHADSFLEQKILLPARKQFTRTYLAREGWKVKV